jgi:hypothetical protein
MVQKLFPSIKHPETAILPDVYTPAEKWSFRPKFFGEFVLSEFGLLNPVFFVGIIWACFAFWPRAKGRPILLYFFVMGAPLFIVYTFWTILSRVLPNWIAPGVLPLFALLAGTADSFWPERKLRIKFGLIGGLTIGFIAVAFLHATEIVQAVSGKPLPTNMDPLHRVRGWKDIALMIDRERQQLLPEGTPAFLIADHYGLTSILTFYIPEAKKNVRDEPLVYYIRSEQPNNQFYYWPGYENRKGHNAIYVREKPPIALPPPPVLVRDFRSVTELGMRTAYYNGQPFREYQLYLCRDLR